MKKIILILFVVLLVASPCHATDWYVDNASTGANNGTSWANAWASLATISWASVKAGDTVYISGGSTSKTYSERLVVGASGTAGNPITIQVGQDEGHTGVVVLDGTSAGNYSGLNIDSKYYVKVSGQVGSGSTQNIKVQNFYYSGIALRKALSNIELAYIEATQNNRVLAASPRNLSLALAATYELETGLMLEVHHCKFHNNRYSTEVELNVAYNGREAYDQIKFHHNEVYDAHGDFIKVAAQGASIYNNTIYDRGTYDASDHTDGIQLYDGYVKIYNNVFYGFHHDGDNSVNSYIRYNPSATEPGRNPNPAYVWIYNNLFYENIPLTHYASTLARRGVELSPQPGTTLNHLYFMNNTMVGTDIFGLFLGFKTTHTTAQISDVIIANNLFIDCALSGHAVLLTGGTGNGTITYGNWGDATDIIIDYNIVHASSGTYTTNSQWNSIVYTWANFLTQSGVNESPANATQDPALDASYLPTASSPYKDAGVDLSAYFTTDKDGNARSAWSIGAYEYGGTADTTPPTISSATINADGDTLTLVFSEVVTVNTSTGFTLGMSGGAAGLTYTSGSGTNTLVYAITGRNIDTAETGTLDYATVANGIEDAAGNDLASTGESDIAVTNNSEYTPSATTYVVTLQASGDCTITPLANQVIVSGETASYTCTANGNSGCAAWTGTCGGTGTTSFTSSAITSDCTVIQGCYKIAPDVAIGSGAAAVTLGTGARGTLY